MATDDAKRKAALTNTTLGFLESEGDRDVHRNLNTALHGDGSKLIGHVCRPYHTAWAPWFEVPRNMTINPNLSFGGSETESECVSGVKELNYGRNCAILLVPSRKPEKSNI